VTTTSILFLLILFLIAILLLFEIHFHYPETIRDLYQVHNYHGPPFLTASG
jgi:hypothetical protein